MKLGVAGFLAVLVAAPLAAQAAKSPARFSVTLRATIVDKFTYDSSRSEEECLIQRTGSGSREIRLRSVRATTIDVSGGAQGLVYRPSRLAVRLSGMDKGGTFFELRRCRAAPLERTMRDCDPRRLTPRRVHAAFTRPSAGRLAFRRSAARGGLRLCGLEQAYPGGWLHLAAGSVDEEALRNGRSLQVVAGGSATRELVVPDRQSVEITQRTTVRWTLTFRRAS